MDAIHGQHGYKSLCPKWLHIQINCSNTVPINSNYKIVFTKHPALFGLLLCSLIKYLPRRWVLLQAWKRRLRDKTKLPEFADLLSKIFLIQTQVI